MRQDRGMDTKKDKKRLTIDVKPGGRILDEQVNIENALKIIETALKKGIPIQITYE